MTIQYTVSYFPSKPLEAVRSKPLGVSHEDFLTELRDEVAKKHGILLSIEWKEADNRKPKKVFEGPEAA